MVIDVYCISTTYSTLSDHYSSVPLLSLGNNMLFFFIETIDFVDTIILTFT